MANLLVKGTIWMVAYTYGFISMVLYGLLTVRLGIFFKKPTEKDQLELQLAHDRLWNLSKDYAGLSHYFLTLPTGFKFHFLSNDVPNSQEVLASSKPLVIFIHGFPDSWAVWRHIVSNTDLQKSATLVAIDMPGYGGTQGVKKYNGTNVLENMTQLIINLRIQYGVDNATETSKKRTVIVAHDWGCVIAMRLAAEAPSLADRFLLSNGPLPSLINSNIRRMLSTARKMLNDAWNSPLNARAPLRQAWQTLAPLRYQLKMSGYIFVMQLPVPFARFFLTGGNQAFMKMVHIGSHGNAKPTPQDLANSMASSMGPSLEESKTETADGETYPSTVRFDSKFANVMNLAGYYRDGAATSYWKKSLETVVALDKLADGKTGLQGVKGALKARSTIFWGKKDIALHTAICLDGMSDFIPKDSQVILLPNSGHFTPIESESRAALTKAVQWAIDGEQGDIGAALATSSVQVIARK
ncbi:uncharacterized protein N7484_009866 [Penicillium longicatenatum]|uniref:uncharacterized protein n=1 Tax=Penicillium longicatenatum TaxID=1561947 RepID=UPI00254815EE|nr:uncharacterized protein N7484_009866 [Penicillium longicatenatum]KAJ5636553.1 hypothetical protein N7484_009866 [Penicillium longicatenatum]